MKPEFGEVVEWTRPISYIASGYFSRTSVVTFYRCRESFESIINSEDKNIYFAHGYGQEENIANFIFEFEKRLGLKRKTTYNKTTCKKVLKINWTKFWRSCYVRRSLFTLLLRIGRRYDGTNFETILAKTRPSSGYTRTVPAVKRFLEGNTFYNGHAGSYAQGWCSIFRHTDTAKKLSKRKNKKYYYRSKS